MTLTSSPESPPAAFVSPVADCSDVRLFHAATAEWRTDAVLWRPAPGASSPKLPSAPPAIQWKTKKEGGINTLEDPH